MFDKIYHLFRNILLSVGLHKAYDILLSHETENFTGFSLRIHILRVGAVDAWRR